MPNVKTRRSTEGNSIADKSGSLSGSGSKSIKFDTDSDPDPEMDFRAGMTCGVIFYETVKIPM
jgi:hypothetical protein